MKDATCTCAVYLNMVAFEDSEKRSTIADKYSRFSILETVVFSFSLLFRLLVYVERHILNNYCLTKISIRAKRSISRVFSLFIVPSPFFVHCPYKGRINRAESVLTGLKPY